jgi:hypothetical protein
MLKGYLKYVKDNPDKYWFKAKSFGWGWVPVRWQGWLVIAIFVAYIFLSSFKLTDKSEPGSADLVLFFVNIIISVSILIFICYKTGEKPRWQWGFPKDNKDVKK